MLWAMGWVETWTIRISTTKFRIENDKVAQYNNKNYRNTALKSSFVCMKNGGNQQ
jgi:hypothetical protein